MTTQISQAYLIHICLDFYLNQKCYAILLQQFLSSNKECWLMWPSSCNARWDEQHRAV